MDSNAVPVGVTGRVASGDDQGKYVRVEEDRSSGGYFVLVAADDQLREDVYDYWVETEADLAAFVQESRWVVDWHSPSLSAEDRDLIGRCLRAAAEGPYFDDWEFRSLFGLERHVVRDLADRWPTDVTDAETERAVNQSISQLLGYPHGSESQLLGELGLDDRAELRRLLDRWRGNQNGE